MQAAAKAALLTKLASVKDQMEGEGFYQGSHAYTARIAGAEEPDTEAPKFAEAVYVLTIGKSGWQWTPGMKTGGNNAANAPGTVEVQIVSGSEVFSFVAEPELVKAYGGTYIPTKGELETLTVLIKRFQALWLYTHRGVRIASEYDLVQSAKEAHAKTLADIQEQIALAPEA